MGSTVATELFKAMGGEGQVIHTQGQLAHTGAQGRAEGFHQTLANYPNIEVVDETPGNWQVDQVASLWQDLLQRFPNVKGGFFHSDDMALAARSVVEAAGLQDQVLLVGVDGLKNACRGDPRGQAPGHRYQPERPHPWRCDLGWLPDRLRHRHGRGRRSEVHPHRRWADPQGQLRPDTSGCTTTCSTRD